MQVTSPRNRRKAIIFTVLLHVILGLAVFVGLEFSDYRPLSGPPVDIIQAEVLAEAPPVKSPVKPEPQPLPQQPEPTPPPPKEPEKEKEDEKKKLIEERERQQAEVKRKEEIAAQEKAKAKKKAEEEAKKKEIQQKAAEEEKKKVDAEAKHKLAAEEEVKRKAAAEQAAREKALQDALAQERREQELIPLKAAYSAAISQQITRNWLRPPEISNDLKCEVKVAQLPDGSVTSARITKSSGNPTFDESVIKAIYKAAPLPQPPTPEVFDKELDIAFCSTGTIC